MNTEKNEDGSGCGTNVGALLGYWERMFDVGDRLTIGNDPTVCIVISVDEEEMTVKRYSDFCDIQEKESKKNKKEELPYYRRFGKFNA